MLNLKLKHTLQQAAGYLPSKVLDYCEICRRCIRDCPTEAIYETPIYNDNGLVTTVDNTKCFPYFATYHGCSICIKVCPFNILDYERLKGSFKGLMKARTH